MLALVVGVAVLAVALAPSPRRLEGTVGVAREQFAKQATAVNVQEAVGALLLAQDRGAQFPVVRDAAAHATPSVSALPISADAADAMLSRGATAVVGLGGVQEVLVANDQGGYVRGDVAVTKVAGKGAELVVFDADGNRFLSSFAPDVLEGEVDPPKDWDFFAYPETTHLANRSAVALEARRDDVVTARWWIDVATGIVLRSERYDASGKPTIMVGYDEVRVGDVVLQDDQALTVLLSKATTSGSRGWCVGLDSCPYSLAGLPLVAYASTTTRGEKSMSLVYSNGLQTLSVGWTEGVLAEGDEVTADAATGLPSVRAWQAGQGVISVATNGTKKLLTQAVDELPGQAPYDRGLSAKFVAGMGRITGMN